MFLKDYIKQSRYDHTKEGQEPFQKLAALGKYAYCGAVTTSLFELCIVRPTNSKAEVFFKGGKHFLVWLGASSTFTLAVLLLTNIRKKDDPWNYFFGTLAAGSFVYHTAPRCRKLIIPIAGFGSLAAAALKSMLMDGYEPFGDTDRIPFRHFSFDFDKTPDIRYTK